MLFREGPDKGLRQLLNVAWTVPQRREVDLQHGETVVEVGLEFALLDKLQQIPVGRADHAHIHLNELIAADPHEFPLLNDAKQLGLHGDGQLADLVEKDSALVGNLKQALLALPRRAGKGALRVAE